MEIITVYSASSEARMILSVCEMQGLNVRATGTSLLRFKEIKEETTYVFESKVQRLNLDVNRTKK